MSDRKEEASREQADAAVQEGGNSGMVSRKGSRNGEKVWKDILGSQGLDVEPRKRVWPSSIPKASVSAIWKIT